MKKNVIFIFIVIITSSQIFAQNNTTSQVLNQKYITDDQGNILMNVNVWGHVNNPGIHLVHDGIDLITLISIVAGPKEGANLSSIKLYRAEPEEDGQLVYTINLEKFYENGDRKALIDIKPNDTIIFEQTKWSKMLSNAGTFNTLLNVVNLFFLIEYNSDR